MKKKFLATEKNCRACNKYLVRKDGELYKLNDPLGELCDTCYRGLTDADDCEMNFKPFDWNIE